MLASDMKHSGFGRLTWTTIPVQALRAKAAPTPSCLARSFAVVEV